MKFSKLMKGYIAWTLAVVLWLGSAFGFGWRAASFAPLNLGPSRSGGGYFPHSSGGFGK